MADSSVLIARYRVVTPMFLSGADQSKAELRLPSFKGVLRFWWRALADERDLCKLHQQENRLFGSTVGVSKIRMRLLDTSLRYGERKKFKRNSWQSYGGYGLIDKHDQTQRDCVEPGSSFSVRINCSRFVLDDASTHSSLTNALVVLGLVGGLGSRSRNGWGSVTLTSLERDGADWQAPTDADALRKELARRFDIERTGADWSALSAQSSFAVGLPAPTPEEAHQSLIEKYRAAVQIPVQDISRREAFGLPRKNGGKNRDQRRAGGTFLHIHQAENNDAIPVALCLPARFLKDQAEPTGGWDTATRFIKGVDTDG